MIVTERKMSGRMSAAQDATGEPASWPTTIATRAMAERVDEPHGIAHHVEDAEGIGIGVVGIVPARGAAVAALIGGDHVIARRRQRQHHLAPAVGEFREAMQQQHGGPAWTLVAGFQHVHRQAVDVGDGA